MINNVFLILGITLLAQCYGQDTETLNLTGTGARNTKTWDFYCSAGMNSKKWSKIEVPSCWEQQGFGSYDYGQVPFNERLNETGIYKYLFDVPERWQNRQVKIVFEGVMTDAEVKINEKLAGPVHQGAFYQFEYDVSRLLKYGTENSIEVFVKKHSDNESVSLAERRADYWVFGGIFRPVFLEAKPRENIEKVAIDAMADGTFKANVYISEIITADEIEIAIQSSQGKEVQLLRSRPKGIVCKVEGKVNNVIPWNPENPQIYRAIFRLKSAGKTIHQHMEKFGFRTVEIRENDGIYVNDARIKFKGVNRHTFHPDYGRTSSKELSIEAVNLMKEMNMNAVRMSHYPPEKHFLDVCDSLGLFVLDELGGWQKPSYDEDIGRKLLKEMIARDVNHPSIILWDNGNEGGWNYALDDDFAKLDPQHRSVIHPSEAFRGINTQHYVDYNYLSHDGYSRRNIFFPTELLHGLYDGGLGAGLEDYWLRLWNDPLSAGTFLWVFADEAVARSDKNGELDSDGNHAPDGILGPYMEKEGSFYTIKKIWSPVYIEKRYITPEFNGIFNIENRYYYTDLDQLSFLVDWLIYPKPYSVGNEKVTYSEKLNIALAPNQKGKLKITLPNGWEKFHNLRIRALNVRGAEISRWTYPIQTPEVLTPNLIDSGSDSDLLFHTRNHEYEIQVGKIIYKFNKENGQLTQVQNEGKIIPLTGGPVFVSRSKTVENVKTRVNVDSSVSIIAIYKENNDSITWTIQKNSLLSLNIAYQPENTTPYAGITFSFPEENISAMKWMGEGPYRVWKNRMAGTNFGVWEKKYNNTITGYSEYQYPEFKGYHAGIFWVDIKCKKCPDFKVFVKSSDIFLRMLTPEQPTDPVLTKVDFPKGDISFLHGINPIGTKFHDSSDLGPQSSPYVFRASKIKGGKLRMNLIFDFRNKI